MVETLNTLWNIFLIAGLIFLIFLVCFTFIGTIYSLLIGNKKKAKAQEKAKEELIKSLEELAVELEKCTCEKSKKKTTKKSTKKESE